ncbi:MAG: ABC transporter ATP-binding protein [Planctomycetota bacterium]|nr:ABC transporter ATP-binding protein [Planctomycetota bacterium]MDG1985280.1 ABC transporter ATP-binding protein [Planctomycetota bacterium]
MTTHRPPPHLNPPSAAVETLGLGRTFRGGLGWRRRLALRDVSLHIESGETVGIVGPNGSGKSTLLRLLAGVDRPSTGWVEVLGAPPTARSVRRRLAFLPDGSPFPPELSARRVLDLIASLYGFHRSERRRRIHEMLDRVGLDDAGEAPIRTFSRGMHRRFGLAQAFLTDPEVILLDEPTAGLDAPGFGVLADLLGAARQRGATTVLASHVASDLIEHCDRLALLVSGEVQRIGTPDELLGDQEVLQLRVRGLRPEGLEAVTRSLEDRGAELLEAGPAHRSLLDLYRPGEPLPPGGPPPAPVHPPGLEGDGEP